MKVIESVERHRIATSSGERGVEAGVGSALRSADTPQELPLASIE